MSMIQLNLTHPCWRQPSPEPIHLRGSVYIGHEQLSHYQVAQKLPEDIQNTERWRSALNHFNGFFALISHTDQGMLAAVDRIRSIPLFYGQTDNHLFLSDDAEWVRYQVGDSEMEPTAQEEFQLVGYVTGSDTLFQNVKQLQPGEYLIATEDPNRTKVKTHRYYHFLHDEPTDYSDSALRDQLDRATQHCMERLIDYANGRQIVVPLSGGYDSRLIVLMLKRLGYENVLTFTYGVPRNKEAKISQQVAETLNLPWYFIEYTDRKWQEAWATEERLNFCRFASNWSSLPHPQDWLAVQEMNNNNIIQNNAIFCPGHAADFVAGSHIPNCTTTDEPLSKKRLLQEIYHVHYSLAPKEHISKRSASFWQNRISNLLEDKAPDTAVKFADSFEYWVWQERQAKYITNSIRVYEYYGYEWWLPFWDKEFISFWQNAPLSIRLGSLWYIQYVTKLYRSATSQNSPNNTRHLLLKKSRRAKDFLPKHLYTFLRKLKKATRSKRSGLAREHRYGKSVYKNLTKKKFKWMGIAAYMFLLENEKPQTGKHPPPSPTKNSSEKHSKEKI